MSLDSINLLTTLDEGVFGLTFFLAPDYFWNPVDGVLPSFAQMTEPESNHLDTITRIALMGSGATMLSFLLFHLLFLKGEADKRVFLRVKLVAYLARLVLFVHTALHPSEMLNREFFAFAAMATAGMILWILTALLNTNVVGSDKMKKATMADFLGLFQIGYALLWAIILIVSPTGLSPDGAIPYVLQTETEENSFDALQLVAFRFQGANLLCVAVLLWDYPPPESLSNWGLSYSFLYWLVFLIGSLDETGILNKSAYIGQLLLQSFVFVWALCVDEINETKPESDLKKSEGKEDPVPELTYEDRVIREVAIGSLHVLERDKTC